jgi:transcriptional regulator with XRE-family HTH domain
MDLSEIGAKLRQERKKLNLTQAQVADHAGLSRATLTNIETGKIDEVGIRKVIRVAEVLGLDLELVPASKTPPTLDDLSGGAS